MLLNSIAALSMDTISSSGIGLGSILLLFLCFSYVSIAEAEVIYRPDDLLSVNCGSPTNFSKLDGRNWTGDMKFLSSDSHDSVVAAALTPYTYQGPYQYARVSNSQFTYSFSVTAGTPKFIRLFFYSTSYDQNFIDRYKALFSVKAGPYTLLEHFNASLNADADENADGTLFREYCINLEDGERLNITFIPSTKYSYAFINGIEIVSMPSYLYYSDPQDNARFPPFVGHMITYPIENNFALETKYRLRVGGAQIPPLDDTGMLRKWDGDDEYLKSQSGPSVDYGKNINLSFIVIPNYTAPDGVYRTLRNMGKDPSMNMKFNLTWMLPIYSGFKYLVRLHFCQLNPNVKKSGEQRFDIFIQDQLADSRGDILMWSENQKGAPVVRDYAISILGNGEKVNLSLKMHPKPTSWMKDAQLNGIEVFKINSSNASLAEPDPPPQTPKGTLQSSNNKGSGNKRTLSAVAVAVAVSSIVLLSVIVAFFLIKRKKNFTVDNGSNKKDGTSRGSGSSSLPTVLCRRFSIKEMRAATNNFDELFVVGLGGFGHVYKGYIDNGSTRVAMKRLKPDSRQGLNEFVNEIEMLSQLRHLHLVSLIGYCYESNEMILVYDFMDRGTLRDHLYDNTDNPSLSWKQRLQICIGAARGLHYLHTGAKHMIIHRDVKSTNILLDEKWMAKVSDFGLSRIGPTGSSITHVSTQVKGSIGYLDPEYYKRQRLTEKSDVYSFGVVLLEVLSGRQPLLRTVEKQQMSLVHWAKHLYQKGSLGAIVDSSLKGEIAPECLRKFGEIAVSCLHEDGTQRPSMNDVVGMLEFVLKLQENAVDGVMLSAGDYEEDSEDKDMFSTSHSTVNASDYSNSSGLNTSTNDSYGSKESARLIPENVFSEIKDPKGR